MGIGDGDTRPDNPIVRNRPEPIGGGERTEIQYSGAGTIAMKRMHPVTEGDVQLVVSERFRTVAQYLVQKMPNILEAFRGDNGIECREENGCLIFEAAISPNSTETHKRQDRILIQNIKFVNESGQPEEFELEVIIDGATYRSEPVYKTDGTLDHIETKIPSDSDEFAEAYRRFMSESLVPGYELNNKLAQAIETLTYDHKKGTKRMYHAINAIQTAFQNWCNNCIEANLPFVAHHKNWGGLGYVSFTARIRGQLVTLEIGNLKNSGTIGVFSQGDIATAKDIFQEMKNDNAAPEAITSKTINGAIVTASYVGTLHKGIKGEEPSPTNQTVFLNEKVSNIRVTVWSNAGDGYIATSDGTKPEVDVALDDDKSIVVRANP